MTKIKVLYVEDEPFLGKIVKESLESRDFIVQMVNDGFLVMDQFKIFQPDICILDVMLPNKDGFTLGKEIRDINATMPIVFLTAKNQTEDLLEGFKSGGNDYIRKPFSMEELIVRVNNLLDLMNPNKNTKNNNGHSINVGKYIFNTQKYELSFGEHVRKLSHREAQILNILIEKKNNSIDRREIMKVIWGDDSFFNSRNLDVYITKLRDYLKEDVDVEIITLKGIGYHFSVT
jgi:two-component system, OmpR family, response regulator VicR